MALEKVHRLGDPNTAGAAVTATKQSFCFVNGEPMATDGDPVASHGPPPHAAPVTANGSPGTFINGVPVNGVGDADTCGHARAAVPHNTYVTT